ncbi:MAG: hypothetical protein M1819_006022 [Sarea resinae]|nr:MAG: hypothetical protein M1819_006022 [Sarea resinae]
MPLQRQPLDDDTWTENRNKELHALRNSINDEALLLRASKLNHGIECRLDERSPIEHRMVGGMHMHLRIQFANSSHTWLARILRVNSTSFSDEFTNYILLSECATMQWLQALAPKVPSPRLYGFGLRNDPSNHVGVAYMLVDELPGTPLSSMNLSADGTRKVYQDLADSLFALWAHPFDRIGSLFLGVNGKVCISATAGDRTGTLPRLGPFKDAKEYYVAWCEAYLDLIASQQLFVRFPVNAYLIFHFLREQARQGKWSDFEENIDRGPFYLKHMDDKGDHILVDEDTLRITGIIDWTFARIVPAYEAFGPSLVTADMTDMYSAVVKRTVQDEILAAALREKNETLAQYAGASDKIRRFTFALSMGVDISWDEALKLFEGLIVTASGLQCAETFDWNQWRAEYLARLGDSDERLIALMNVLDSDLLD